MNFGVNEWFITLNYNTYKIGVCPLCVKVAVPSGINFGYVNTVNFVNARNSPSGIPAWDIMPGGKYSVDIPDLGQNPFSNSSVLGLNPTGLNITINWINTTPSAVPCTDISVYSASINDLMTSLNGTIKSRGLDFCFIPTLSGIDYQGASSQDHDVYSENKSITFQNTPFDVIYGEVNGGNALTNDNYPQDQYSNNFSKNNYLFPSYNTEHTTIFNHHLTDSLLINDTQNELFSYWLNREIGDEELYLENWHCPWDNAKVQAEYHFYGGHEQNPYYEYPGTAASKIFKIYSNGQWPFPGNPAGFNLSNNGIFSSPNPLEVGGNDMFLLYDGSFSDNGIIGNYTDMLEPMAVCTLVYGRQKAEEANPDYPFQDFIATTYPNPVSRDGTIYIGELPEGNKTIFFYDLQGNLVYEGATAENTFFIQLTSFQLAGGVYFLNVVSKDSVFTSKISLQ